MVLDIKELVKAAYNIKKKIISSNVGTYMKANNNIWKFIINSSPLNYECIYMQYTSEVEKIQK